MATHAELRTQLGDLLDVDTNRYPDATRTVHLNHAIKSLELDVDTQWGQAQDTFATVAAQKAYSMTADLGSGSPSLTFSHPIGLTFVNSDGAEVDLEHVTWEEYRADHRAEDEDAEPVEYCFFGETLYLGPTPDDAYTVTVDYFGFQAELSADGDTNPWTVQAPNLVLYRACVLATEWLLEDERVGLWQSRADTEEMRLIIHLSQLEQSGRQMEATEY